MRFMPLIGIHPILTSHMHSLAGHLCPLPFLRDSHKQNNGVPLTVDEPKYTNADIQAKVLAILTPTGYVDSVSADGEGPVGLVLDTTSFYAEQGEERGQGRGEGRRVGWGRTCLQWAWCSTQPHSTLSRVRRGGGKGAGEGQEGRWGQPLSVGCLVERQRERERSSIRGVGVQTKGSLWHRQQCCDSSSSMGSGFALVLCHTSSHLRTLLHCLRCGLSLHHHPFMLTPLSRLRLPLCVCHTQVDRSTTLVPCQARTAS